MHMLVTTMSTHFNTDAKTIKNAFEIQVQAGVNAIDLIKDGILASSRLIRWQQV